MKTKEKIVTGLCIVTIIGFVSMLVGFFLAVLQVYDGEDLLMHNAISAFVSMSAWCIAVFISHSKEGKYKAMAAIMLLSLIFVAYATACRWGGDYPEISLDTWIITCGISATLFISAGWVAAAKT